MGTVNLRNLEQIQESDPRGGFLTPATVLLSAFAGMAVLGAGIVAWQDRGTSGVARPDPLAALVEESQGQARVETTRLRPSEATFAAVLSDAQAPTTAYAAVSPRPARDDASPAERPAPVLERLRVVPMPAGDLVGAGAAIETAPDRLTHAAVLASTPAESELGPGGAVGGYQVQVSAFRTAEEAQRLVHALRLRQHRAHLEQGVVKDRTWYRVRVGPLPSREAAVAKQIELANKEHLRPFVVSPDDASSARPAQPEP